MNQNAFHTSTHDDSQLVHPDIASDSTTTAHTRSKTDRFYLLQTSYCTVYLTFAPAKSIILPFLTYLAHTAGRVYRVAFYLPGVKVFIRVAENVSMNPSSIASDVVDDSPPSVDRSEPPGSL